MSGYGYTSKYKGKFKPKNPNKYAGNPDNIIYRSALEYNWFCIFDRSKTIKRWGSEEFFIPYYNKLDNKQHRYFVDIFCEMQNGDKFIIEIKPYSETQPPKRKNTKKSLRFIENQSKWQAANVFAKRNNLTFLVLTEKELNDFR